jgi:2-dehydropantoate 2-reductase
MKYLCYGLGAIGTYIGGSLAMAGEGVVFLEQPSVLQKINSQGGLRLKIENEHKVFSSPQIVGNLEEAMKFAPFDAAILAVKSFDTPTVLEQISPYANQFPPILCLQNGVENEEKIAQVLGEDHIVYGSVTSAVGRNGPGDIRLERLRGVGIGGTHPMADEVTASFSRAGLQAQRYPNGPAMKWSKLLTNLQANASCAILDMTPVEVFDDPALFRLEMRQLAEALAIMRAMKLPVVNLPGTPVQLLALLAEKIPAWIGRPLARPMLGKGRGGKMPSFHIDLHSGRPGIEVDYLNGAVVRFGQKLNLPTPVNKVLNETLLAMSAGKIALDDFRRQPKKLINLISENS